jgi:hypothetical protein
MKDRKEKGELWWFKQILWLETSPLQLCRELPTRAWLRHMGSFIVRLFQKGKFWT